MQNRTVRLGDEYDDALREALVAVLRELGGYSESHEWGVGGSQEIENLEVDVRGQRVVVESETYVGLSITGEDSLVSRIEALVRLRLQDSKS
jgi:hypothetical protein